MEIAICITLPDGGSWWYILEVARCLEKSCPVLERVLVGLELQHGKESERER